MFEDISTLKSGQFFFIYFTEHDIYFSEQMFILLNINLEFKSALRTNNYLLYSTSSVIILYFLQHIFYNIYIGSRGKQEDIVDELEDLLEAHSLISEDRMPR